MKRIFKNKTFLLCFSSFILTGFVWTLALTLFGIYPFGDKSVLIIDMSQQYIQLMCEYRHILLEGHSLLYSWDAGMGLNFLGLLAYYLASPFNFILVLLPLKYITEAATLIIVLKGCFASAAFSFFARKTLNAAPHICVTASVAYALCGWAVAFNGNLMWHDALIALPLLVHFTKSIVYDGKWRGFLLCLVYIFFSQYYMAYIAGAFSFICFIAFSIASYQKDCLKNTFKRFLLFMGCAVLAAGLSMCLLLPTINVLGQNMGVLGQELPGFELLYNPLEVFQMLLCGSFDEVLLNKLPNLYCGTITLILAPQYIVSGRIPKKERLISLLILLFMFVTMNIGITDMIWQCFDSPNGFYFRYSFIVSFILLSIAVRAFSLKAFSVKGTLISSASVLLYSAVCFFSNSEIITPVSFTATSLLVLFLTVLLCMNTAHQKKSLGFALVIICILDTFTNSYISLTRIDSSETVYESNSFSGPTSRMIDTTDYISQIDSSFYRIEKNYGRDFNDSLAANYRGIGHYSSTTNAKLNDTLSALGFFVQDNTRMWNSSLGSTPITDSLLSVKYKLMRNENFSVYRKINSIHGSDILVNDYALPIGFVSDNKLIGYEPLSSDSPFDVQSEVLNLIAASELEYFVKCDYQISLENASLSDGKYTRNDEQLPGSVTISCVRDNSYPIYCDFSIDRFYSDVRVYVNNSSRANCFNILNPYIVSLETGSAGEKTEIRIEFDSEISFDVDVRYLDMKHFEKSIDTLHDSSLNITSFSDTAVNGKITAKNDGVLFTSIPYDSGWKVTVDGKEAEVIPLLDNAFAGVIIKSGEHDIVFSYTPPWFIEGCVISAISVLCWILVELLCSSKRKRSMHNEEKTT